jgi:hypothetical protein
LAATNRAVVPLANPYNYAITALLEKPDMAKPHRKLKKANHGKRPANSKARRLKRKDIRT